MPFFPDVRAHTVSQGLGAIATATGYMIGLFKLRYPHVHNMADAGEILAGPIGREVLGGAQAVFMIFICGSHVLTGLIAFDTSKHAVFVTRRAPLTFSYAVTAGASCSVLWAAVAAIICLVLTLPRTLNGISYMSVVSFISIISTYHIFCARDFDIYFLRVAAVLITMIGVSVAGHKGGVKASAGGLTFASAFLAVTDIVRIHQFPNLRYNADAS